MTSAFGSDNFKAELTRLVDIFRKNLPHYKIEGYDESSLRTDFVNPFWRALGWDVENRDGLPQPLREVQVETRVHIGGKKKKADYLFRTNGLERFVPIRGEPPKDKSLNLNSINILIPGKVKLQVHCPNWFLKR